MTRKCKVPGRNYCAPGGKIAALFVDIDGTVTKCQKHFDDAENRFGSLMDLCGLDGNSLRQRAIALKLTHKDKFERNVLSSSFQKVYRDACKKKGILPQKHILGTCRDIGDSPFFREPELYPNAAIVLSRAWHNFFIIAVTIGDRDAQYYKIKRAGLRIVFDHVAITGQDNKSEIVANTIEDLQIDPHHSLFIGNSARSDGQCLRNTNFIFMQVPQEGWAFDHSAGLPKDTGYKLIEAHTWREAEERGIIRMQLLRQVALDEEEENRGSGCPCAKHDNCHLDL